MSQTKIGALKAAATNKRLYGADFYGRIGQIGGSKGHTGGFYGNREAARIAGAKGGTISRRGKAKYQWVEDKPDVADEAMFVDSNIDFGEGFFQPTWKQRMLNRIRSR